jgi:hypothetical protein
MGVCFASMSAVSVEVHHFDVAPAQPAASYRANIRTPDPRTRVCVDALMLPHPVVVRMAICLKVKTILTFGKYLPSSQRSPIFEAPASQ